MEGGGERMLYDLGCAFAARLELDELVPLVVENCRKTFHAEGVAVLLLDSERQELFFPYMSEEDPNVADSLAHLRFPATLGIAGAVLSTGQAIRIDDVSSDPRFYPEIDRHTGLTTRELLSAPLVTRRGTIGLIEVVNHHAEGPFTDAHLDVLSALAASIAIAMENAWLWSQLKGSAERLRSEVGALRRDIARRDRFHEMIGNGPTMREVFALMESAAASPIAVLIQGETGTGKELVARGIHRASVRAEEPFLAVNCAAVPETLLESELFGHRRGAFTGATHDQRGLFEAASGGTIFLDEIGEMSPSMQGKLLRVLQEGEIMPVGERHGRKIDVRVISATNRDLAAEVARRSFRDDLYYRLGAFPIALPPLRLRREDIPPLVDRFLAAAAERHHKRVAGMDPAVLDLLISFDWPGNVRELQNEIERAVALAGEGEIITSSLLSAKLRTLREGTKDDRDKRTTETSGRSSDLRDARAAFEIGFISKVLREHHGNVSRAAHALGISRVALQKKMKEYGLRQSP